MAAKKRPRKRPEKPPDDPEYVAQWARDLVAAIGNRRARKRLASYRALAEDEKLAKRDRAVAAQRTEALAGLLE